MMRLGREFIEALDALAEQRGLDNGSCYAVCIQQISARRTGYRDKN